MEKENSGKNLGKTKEKERAKNQAVTLREENFMLKYKLKKKASSSPPPSSSSPPKET